MNPNVEYYEANLKRAKRFQLNLDHLKTVDSMEELDEGYCILCDKENEYAHAYKDKVLIVEGDDMDIYRFIMLRLFLDKYGTGKYELPELDKPRWVKEQTKEEVIADNRAFMKVMLKPLNSYEDLLARFDDVKAAKELGWDIRNYETFNGCESQKKTLNGAPTDWERDDYRVYMLVSEDTWDAFSAVDRGNGRLQFLMRIYGALHLHEYILNNHLNAVG